MSIMWLNLTFIQHEEPKSCCGANISPPFWFRSLGYIKFSSVHVWTSTEHDDWSSWFFAPPVISENIPNKATKEFSFRLKIYRVNENYPPSSFFSLEIGSKNALSTYAFNPPARGSQLKILNKEGGLNERAGAQKNFQKIRTETN